jgi:ribonucleoside-diphosphate reductase alpha chain
VQRQRRGAAPLRHVVEDSTEGWGDALYLGLCAWFAGGDVDFDLSGVRRAGAVLRVKGGRASGPEPLRRMLATVRAIVLARQDRHLRPIDAHNIACAVGLAAVSGGMRRTAMIRRHT